MMNLAFGNWEKYSMNGTARSTSRPLNPDLQPFRILTGITFDAIVSDFQMPEMNGITLLREIRSTSDIPFILFTGKGREEVVIDAINNGADFTCRNEAIRQPSLPDLDIRSSRQHPGIGQNWPSTRGLT